MANYLYTITAHASYGPFNSSVEGVSIVNTYDDLQQQMVKSPTMLIETPGEPNDGQSPGVVGANSNPAATDRAIFTRVSDGGSNVYGGGVEYPYFSLLIGDKDTTSVDTWDTVIQANNFEFDWVGNAASLTWHTPYIGIEVYTLIVPTDNVVYQSATQRIGNVLVWHIPAGQLGVYGQNANLPFRVGSIPIAADTDIKAADKIWGAGFGLIYGDSAPGDNIPFINPGSL